MAHYAKSLTRYASAVVSSSSTAANSAFFYPTADALATVLAAGYFNDSRAQLKVGDVIHVAAGQGGTVDHAVLKVTAAPASGNVTTAIASGISQLTDNSGGTASDTIAAIADSATADAIASIVAQLNKLAS